MTSRFLNIDIVGFCNLKCPSCPVGNFAESKQPSGLMELDTFKRILQKAQSEFKVVGVGLFNWTEPLLHPSVEKFIETINSYGLRCFLSTNLNNIKHLEAAVKANPYHLRISISGFRQETYSHTHRGGNVETVLRNMKSLAKFKELHGATTRVSVLFHRYKDNLDDELLLRNYVKELGFEFDTCWAYLMPVEKVIGLMEGDLAPDDDARLVLDKLTLPPRQALEVCKPLKENGCKIIEDITIDCKGNVQLCCASFDTRSNIVGNFLDMTTSVLQEQKYRHNLCVGCVKHGAQVLMNYGTTKLDDVALGNIPAGHLKRIKADVRRKRVRTAMESVYHTLRINKVVKPETIAGWLK